MLRKAERLLRSRSDAEDIVQEIFVHTIETQGDPSLAYLYQAVTNRCLNLLRDQKNRERLLQRQDALLRGPIRTRCDDRVIDLDLLAKLVTVLESRDLEVLVYHFFDDMAQEEVAELMGIDRKTVAKHLGRIQDKVRELS